MAFGGAMRSELWPIKNHHSGQNHYKESQWAEPIGNVGASLTSGPITRGPVTHFYCILPHSQLLGTKNIERAWISIFFQLSILK